MKTFLSLGIALLALASAQAQIFRSEAVNGAVIGGIAGGIIGHNSGDLRHNGWKGAAIGAVAGGLIGQAVGEARAERDYARYGGAHGGYVYRSEPRVQVGIGYHSGWGHRGWGHHGYRHHGFYRGHWDISYGASLGYYRGYGWGYPHAWYGGYGDYVYRTPVVVQQPTVVQAPVQQQAQPAPQQVTIINNYYNSSTPMSAANGLFGR